MKFNYLLNGLEWRWLGNTTQERGRQLELATRLTKDWLGCMFDDRRRQELGEDGDGQ